MTGHGVEAVRAFTGLLRELLERAHETKQSTTIEPPLVKSHFTELLDRITTIPFGNKSQGKRVSQYAVIETATRAVFNEIVVSRTSISDISTF